MNIKKYLKTAQLILNTTVLGFLTLSFYMGLFIVLSIIMGSRNISISGIQKSISVNLVVIPLFTYIYIQLKYPFIKEKLNRNNIIFLVVLLVVHTISVYFIDIRNSPNDQFINIAIIIPICEELLFRGLLLFFLCKLAVVFKLEKTNLFLIISNSAIFSLMHIKSRGAINLPFTLFYTFVYGATLTFFRIKTNSIILPILLHITINSVAYILAMY